MDKALRPERFDVEPSCTTATKQWKHWYFTFSNFVTSIATPETDKFQLLANHVSPDVFEYIADCNSYDSAISVLVSLYIKPKNVIYARHLLSTTKQEPGQKLDHFLQKLKLLSKDCDFKPVTADEYRNETVRDAFIRGLSSNTIRQRLLEQDRLDLDKAYTLARTLETAETQSTSYNQPCTSQTEACAIRPTDYTGNTITEAPTVAATIQKCFFCGYNKHPRSKCPAKEATCKLCNKIGHFHRVCRSSHTKHFSSSVHPTISCVSLAAVPLSLSKAVVSVTVNGLCLNALIDTGSSESYISQNIVNTHHWPVHPSTTSITMASTDLSSTTRGHCLVTLSYYGKVYDHVKLSILDNLCSDVLLGHDFLQQHKLVQFHFGGPKPPLSLCNFAGANITPPRLFASLTPDCKPIVTKSRRLSFPDQYFVQTETKRLLKEDIIEPSTSPWRAQVLVVSNENHKKRMVVDYSQTINKFTLLDAFPLPRIDEMVEKISHFSIFSTLDLKSAYHQIPLRDDEKHFTAFEACGNLYQFRRIPFGVTNGVACFQRIIDAIIQDEKVHDTFAYIDNVTVCGRSTQEHDANLQSFLSAAAKYGLTFNESKAIMAVETITLLGYQISKGLIKPDPARFESLRQLEPPRDAKSQQRIVGIFSYYSNWISHFSDKIHPLVHNSTFPIPEKIRLCFENLKLELEKAAVVTVDYQKSLVVETDASDIAIAATLNQEGRPVAFFSRTLNPSERNHSSVEKEAYAIVEALRRWRHYLIGVRFTLVTDQRSVMFMFDEKHKTKVKNDKILRWRIELSAFQYDIVYRPGKLNLAADALSRGFCASSATIDLEKLHQSLCHPGVTRMIHFVRSKNLPFSTDDVRRVTSQCHICSEVKPRSFKPPTASLIKATQPFERLSVDFKGPLPSASHNKYLFTIIDEYSRFPFAFACRDTSTQTVINCFNQLFTIFGLPSYIHSDRGSSFLSTELKNFLNEKGVATSRTTPYNPTGNGQVERLNFTLWTTVQLVLRSRKLDIRFWELVLLDALHAVRSLLCTATNATPHERMFNFNRRSTSGTSLPSWLMNNGPVFLKNFRRTSKYDPLVEEVELLECNPQYAHVKLPNGKEDTVSVKHLTSRPCSLDVDQSSTNEEITEHGNITPESSVPQINPQVADTDIFPVETEYHNNGQNMEAWKTTQGRVRPYQLRSREV